MKTALKTPRCLPLRNANAAPSKRHRVRDNRSLTGVEMRRPGLKPATHPVCVSRNGEFAVPTHHRARWSPCDNSDRCVPRARGNHGGRRHIHVRGSVDDSARRFARRRRVLPELRCPEQSQVPERKKRSSPQRSTRSVISSWCLHFYFSYWANEWGETKVPSIKTLFRDASGSAR